MVISVPAVSLFPSSSSPQWSSWLVFIFLSLTQVSLSAGVPNLQAMDQYLLSGQWHIMIRNKVHDKCNVLNHPVIIPSFMIQEKLSSMKLVPGAEKAGDHCPQDWSSLFFRPACCPPPPGFGIYLVEGSMEFVHLQTKLLFNLFPHWLNQGVRTPEKIWWLAANLTSWTSYPFFPSSLGLLWICERPDKLILM